MPLSAELPPATRPLPSRCLHIKPSVSSPPRRARPQLRQKELGLLWTPVVRSEAACHSVAVAMFRFAQLAYFAASLSLAVAHTVIVYPGWRGNNIHTNGTVSSTDESIKPGSLGINWENGTYGFPYGMQWMYPCTLSAPDAPRLGPANREAQAAACPHRRTAQNGR